MLKKVICFNFLFTLVFFHRTFSAPDEGMWTFDNPPTKQLDEQYGFSPTQEWLDHIRLASVRFMNGGSGAFVSPQGLVLTNHHVAMEQLQKISTSDQNIVENGFYAKTQAEEIACPDLEVNILVSMKNVTDQVMAVIKKDMNNKAALKARKTEIARIEREGLTATGLRSDVVELYRGGEYWLYQYKKFTDVRLVMVPDYQTASYGGDHDNFTYPRYDLDMAFFRVYENGRPIQSDQYFRWNSTGVSKDELVFISGHPGSTNRHYTYEQLEYERDYEVPIRLEYLNKRLHTVHEYASQGAEQHRRATSVIQELENSLKAYQGVSAGLKDKQTMLQKKQADDEFRRLIASKPEWRKQYGDLWDTIASVVQQKRRLATEKFYRQFRGSRMANHATNIVRYFVEMKKPDGERLDGFHDAQLEELKFYLFSPAPIYKDLEQVILSGTLKMSQEKLGVADEFINIVLNNRPPEEVAHELIAGSQLDNAQFRQTLFAAGEKDVAASDDPLIQIAGKVEPILQQREQWYEEHIESILTPANMKIADARFAVFGNDIYPDATFTLRLGFGTVKGYPMNGTIAPYKTTLYGIYDRALSFDQEGDFYLPQRFWERREALDLSTPVNFVCSCDAVGGSSGSPVLNKDLELVGILFDGNIESLVGDFIFNEENNRSVSVHSAYMILALRQLYDAQELANEIEGK